MNTIVKRIILIFLSFLLIGCTTPSTDTTVLHPESIENLEYEELCGYLDDSYTFLLYIGRDDCSDCKAFKPYLEDYLDTHKNTGIYYLNIKAYRDAARKKDASKEEKQFFKNLYKELDFDWTPTLEVIQNGKIVEKYEYLSEDYYNIKDESQREKEIEKYIKEFKTFMNQYFKTYY